MDVSIILVNYNTKMLTVNSIKSVLKKTSDLEYEIIVVDNNSVDGSVDELKKEFAEKITIIQSCANIGFGRANNLGICKASGKYVFFLNTDTLLINNAIKILFDFMENTPSAGICGGNLFDLDGTPLHSFAVIPNIKNVIMSMLKSAIRSNKEPGFNYSSKPKEVGYITGADMMVKKNVLEKSGYFDPYFFMYCEETELTARIKKLGYKAFSVPQAEIYHINGASWGSLENDFNEFKFRVNRESEYKYFEKVHGNSSVKKFFVIIMIFGWIKKTFFKSHNPHYKEQLKITFEEYEKWKARRAKNIDKELL